MTIKFRCAIWAAAAGVSYSVPIWSEVCDTGLYGVSACDTAIGIVLLPDMK
ncbi:hypothetical protein [Mesobacillus foraminis]|uniref:hypothetical protein n=1 Tax=Mesobacillus foraminis TaxID=279826 RepID=UPI0018EEB731|nr:hypothetical protein [Mesobacillus foraminis]